MARIARFDPRRGINSILVEPISRDAAEQRRGRAGRTGPGRCIRLWSEAEQEARPQRDTAEVRRVDLSESLLLLAAHGVEDFHAFPWFESPDPASMEKAQALLQDLGAFDSTGTVTACGQDMARLPLHPRFARMLLEGIERGVLSQVAKIAAIAQAGRSTGRLPNPIFEKRKFARWRTPPIPDPIFLFSCVLWNMPIRIVSNFRTVPKWVFTPEPRGGAWEASRQLEKMAERMGSVGATGDDSESAVCRALLSAFPTSSACATTRVPAVVAWFTSSGRLRRESLVEATLFVAAEVEERMVRGEATLLLGMATAVKWTGSKRIIQGNLFPIPAPGTMHLHAVWSHWLSAPFADLP